jgi:hypothetical protein
VYPAHDLGTGYGLHHHAGAHVRERQLGPERDAQASGHAGLHLVVLVALHHHARIEARGAAGAQHHLIAARAGAGVDPVLVGEVAERHARLVGQAMVAREGDLVGVVEQVLGLEVGEQERLRLEVHDDRHVDVARAQLLVRVGQLSRAGAEVDVWVAAVELSKRARNESATG